MDGFLDMCDQFQWREDDAQRKDALRALQDAMVRKFNDLYGVSADELWAWQRLCRAIGIAPVSNSLRDCRSAVLGTHVNLCDLLCERTLGRPRRFTSAAALAGYSTRTGRIFPKNNPHAGALLQILVRNISDGSTPGTGRGVQQRVRSVRGAGGSQ
ncbi:hypothetical protein C8Q76DRAFT_623876 [Earliella scabrosa]|nr:hypothetical protein C8Q76DRAFT_623876 [Earliella scabrosa]